MYKTDMEGIPLSETLMVGILLKPIIQKLKAVVIAR
jgi:hypothetical protein